MIAEKRQLLFSFLFNGVVPCVQGGQDTFRFVGYWLLSI